MDHDRSFGRGPSRCLPPPSSRARALACVGDRRSIDGLVARRRRADSRPLPHDDIAERRHARHAISFRSASAGTPADRAKTGRRRRIPHPLRTFRCDTRLGADSPPGHRARRALWKDAAPAKTATAFRMATDIRLPAEVKYAAELAALAAADKAAQAPRLEALAARRRDLRHGHATSRSAASPITPKYIGDRVARAGRASPRSPPIAR